MTGRVERLLLLLPDQLNEVYLEEASLDRKRDVVLQMELVEDFNHVPGHRQRTVLFLAAMRHFAQDLEDDGWRGAYVRLEDRRNDGGLRSQLRRAWQRLRPSKLVVFRPGDFRTLAAIRETVEALEIDWELLEDPHFLVTPSDFDSWASGRKQLTMEHFYRWMRRRLGVLLTEDGKPEGGDWNYDADNRKRLTAGAPDLPTRKGHSPDAVTRDVIQLVERRFSDSPGEVDGFAWPVTRSEALAGLEQFIRSVLPAFGHYQDAMKAGEPWLFHSLLSPALNLKLLDPRECVEAAEAAYRSGAAPLNSVEGLVRQIIGWREFIRGVYWREGPEYAERNHLGEQGRLPRFYWTGESELRCVEQAVGQVLRHGYGHHIQRLMVTGNLALTAGVEPREVSDWYLGMYVDAMDWVTLPNVLGMTLYADGGVVGSKPYAASGRYIDRMSDYCGECRFDPGERTGSRACPLTTFYWEFLSRHRRRLESLGRMRFALHNLDRLSESELAEIAGRAADLRRRWGICD